VKEAEEFSEWFDEKKILKDAFYEIAEAQYGRDWSFNLNLNSAKYGFFCLKFTSPISIRINKEANLQSYWRNGVKIKQHNVLIAHKSEFISWISSMSDGIYDMEKMLHFAVFSDDICVEVLSIIEPTCMVLVV